jgi:hypothetical protein
LMRSHGAYFDRYGFPVSFGYALLCGFVLANICDFMNAPAVAASAVLLTFFAAFQLGPGRRASAWSKHQAIAQTKSIENIRTDLPLVAASGLTFLEMDHYESSRLTNRLYYLTNRGLALRYANATIFEGMPKLKDYFPIRAHVTEYSAFVENHSEFLVLGTPDYPEDWLLRALLDQGYEVRLMGNFPGLYKDSQLYKIRHLDH